MCGWGCGSGLSVVDRCVFWGFCGCWVRFWPIVVVSWGACAERCGCGACGRGLPFSPWVCGFVGPPVSPWTRCSAGGAAGFSVDPLFCWFGSPLAGGSVFAWSPEGAIGCGQAAVSWWVRPLLRPFSVFVPVGVAHKGGIYATLGRTQGRDQALVCGVCFVNRGPCVRTPRKRRAIRSSPPGVLARASPPGVGRAPGAGFRRAPGAGFGLACDAGARCLHREGVVDIMRGLLARRGGYNARRCRQHALVRTSRVGADNARRRPRGGVRSLSGEPVDLSVYAG